MLAFLLLQTSLAAEPASFEALVTQGPMPAVAARCAPLQVLSGAVDSVAAMPLFKQDLPEDLTAMSSAALKSAGFGLDGAVTVLGWKVDGEDSSRLTLPFSGTPEQLDAWLAGFKDASPVRQADGTWKVGQKGAVIRLSPGSLALTRGEAPTGTWTPPAGLLDGFDAEGCSAMLSNPGDAKLPNVRSLALHVSTGDVTSLIGRVWLVEDAPAVLQVPKGRRPRVGRAEEAPSAVLSLGVSPSAVLEELGSGGPMLEKLEKLRAPLETLSAGLSQAGIVLERGMTVAIWRSSGLLRQGPKLAYAAIVPVATTSGKHPSGRKLLDGIEATLSGRGLAVTREGGALQVQVGPQSLAFGARRGRIYLASDADLLDGSMARFGGEPWADREFRDFASEWALALQGDVSGAGSRVAGRTGLRARGPIVELEASGTGAMGAAGAGMLAAMAIPNFVAMQAKAKRAEVPANVNGIYTAMLAREAEGLPPLALGPAPRAPEALNKERVAWSAETVLDPGWAELGWVPGGELRGSYWVELDEAGAPVVHGMIDADGDGAPAHYILDKQRSGAEAMTPEDVY